VAYEMWKICVKTIVIINQTSGDKSCMQTYDIEFMLLFKQKFAR